MRGMVVFCAPKAGMAKVDTAKVNSVVYQMSKDSLHFRHQQHLADNTARRIHRLQRRKHTLRSEPSSYLAHLNQRATDLLQSLESQRDLSHVWLHIDLDSFYAAVELLDPARAHLRDKPVAVGSMSMICTSNYHARQYGVRSAMPGFIAVKLCPQLHFIPTDFVKYKAVAAVFRAIFAQYDPTFESTSLDEAYLDITAHLAAKQARHPIDQPWDRDTEAAAVAAEIRQRVFDATQLTCSAGIACNRMLAKIATDVNKPNGQHLVPSDLPAILSFISPLQVRQVPGIGKVLERTLHAIGVQTVGQMRDDEYRALLVDCFSEITYGWLFRVSLGLGRVEHEDEDERRRKSVSTERTFRDISTYQELTSKADDIARSLFEDMTRLNVKGRTLTLKLKTAAFEVKQRGVSVDRGLWIQTLDDVKRVALQLLKDELNLLLAGKKVKLAAEEKSLEKAVAAAVVSGARTAGKMAVGSPFDGLMRIRLMGLRLSALHIEGMDEVDEELVGDGSEQATGSSTKKRGSTSILRFTRRLDNADSDAIVDEERAGQQSGRKRQKAEADNTDISRYFDVTSPDKPYTHLPPTETADRRGKRSKRKIESYFSQSVAPADGAKCADEVDEALEDDADEDEWMELLHDAAEATAHSPQAVGDASLPLAPTSPADLPPTTQQPTPRSAVPTSTSSSPSSLSALPAIPTSSHLPAPTAVMSTSDPPAVAVPMSCPVCGDELYDTDRRPMSNLSLNTHIDACLRNQNHSPIRHNDRKPPHPRPTIRTAMRTAAEAAAKARSGQGTRAEEPGRSASLVDMWKRKG